LRPLASRGAAHSRTRGYLHDPHAWAQEYTDIISNVPIGWVLKVSSSLELCSSLQFYHFFCANMLLLTDFCVHNPCCLSSSISFCTTKP
jgi:hypothetical protein